MRITPNSTLENSLYYIQINRDRLNNLQEMVASGNIYNRPSDDPVATRLLVSLNEQMKAADQYNSNIAKAGTWYQMTNVSLTGMTSFVEQAMKAVSSITGGETDPNVLNNAVMQLKSIKGQIVDMGNTTSNGVFLFGGTNNLTKPFIVNTGDMTNGNNVIANMSSVTGLAVGMPVSGAGIPDGTTISAIGANTITMSNAATANLTGSGVNVYAGNSASINIEISQGSTEELNIPGNYLLMPPAGSPYGSTDILKTLDQLIVDVQASNTAGIQSGKTTLYNASIQLNSAQSDLQSRLVRVQTSNQMNSSIIDSLSTVYANLQNVDYAKLGVEMSQQMTALEATLSSTAKISQMSLLDYM